MAATDQYNYEDGSLNAPANDVFAITPSDTADLPYVTRFIRANAAGVVKVTTRSNGGGTTNAASAISLNFAAGETRAVRVSRVWATGTTATGLEGMV